MERMTALHVDSYADTKDASAAPVDRVRSIRLRAAGLHFAMSAVVAGALLLLVMKVWYPAPLFEIANGGHIFLTLVGCDIVLGPVMTLIIFNVRKPKSELVRDIACIAFIQVCALGYGVFTLLQARPVLLVYSTGRFIATLANETVETPDAAPGAVPQRVAGNSWNGPRIVGISLPKDREERRRLLAWAIQRHVGLFQVPAYLVPFEDVQDDAKAHARTAEQIASEMGIDVSALNGDASGFPEANKHFVYLPLQIRDSLALAVLNGETGAWQGIRVLPPRH
jgi:hypothetical protein